MTTPDRAQLRQFLQKHYSDDELETLCFDYFPDVGDQFTIGMSKPQKVRLLIGYAERHGVLINLLTAVGGGAKAAVYQQFFAAAPEPAPARSRGCQSSPPASPTIPPTPAVVEVAGFRNPGYAKMPQNYVDSKTGLEMIYISPEPFLYGENKDRRELPGYWVSKTPVTNTVYKRFLDANPQHRVPNVNESWAQPYNWDEKKRTFPADKADHPVVLVSWHDAVAFARRAGMMLPTEEQWEKAARGTDGRDYPWGTWREGCANTSEARVRGTTAVGRYSPQGDSPYGCMDMVGNVWEWCLNKYGNPTDVTIDQSKVLRALRGGSWGSLQSSVCSSFRSDSQPLNRDDLNGFRVVRRPSSR
ncbi:MAG: formylglycine-generating enzyme family protein [Anaerolineales bacterium]|nr:formylglycine-generating enzyme family protein [Anaerolineales bacterium]